MKWTAVGIGSLLALFVGCSAAPEDATGDEPVESASAAAGTCPSFTATLQEHVTAGRAQRFDTTFLFFTFSNFTTTGTNPESIGAIPTQVVTLYPKNGGFTANASLCVAPVCGNGVLESTELCDGSLFPSGVPGQPPGPAPNCSAYGATPPWVSGDMKCSATCQLDTSGCGVATCGNGVVEDPEACDGPGVVMDCTQDGDDGVFTGGQVTCGRDCKLDVSKCTSNCGNGVLDPGEDCDGTRFSAAYTGKTCADLQVTWPTWPFGTRVNYLPGPITCNKYCRITPEQICATPHACYYVIVAGGQPSAGVKCF